MTHRWQCDPATGVQGLRWTEGPDLVPARGEALVAVAAASLNFPDLLLMAGKYQWQPAPPFTPGAEFAGTVVALGPGTTGLGVGDRVMTVGTTGGFATHAVVPVDKLKLVPLEFSWVQASLLLVAYGTAMHGLLDRGALQPGEWVLVLGAAGGVGSAAIQVGKAAGARVIAAVSSTVKAAQCLSLGADAAINYSTDDLRTALRAIVPDGPNVVFDPVGGALAEPAFRSIAWRGRYLVIGFADGDIPRLPLNLMLLKGASVVGVFWGAFDSREPAASAELIGRLVRGRTAGWLRPVIERVMPMHELPAACTLLGSRAAHGKIVLVNGDAAQSPASLAPAT